MVFSARGARRIDQVAEGLTILSKYDVDGFGIAAEHDVIYAGGGAENVTAEDANRLRELGWRLDATVGSWAVFT